MPSFNQVQIIGYLGRDPETRATVGGNSVCNLTVATDESYIDKSGKKNEKVEWHKVTAWGNLAEICGKYLSKGRLVYISGKLQTRKWQDKDGNDRYQTEIIAQQMQILDKREGGNQGGGQRQTGNKQAEQRSPEPQFPSDATSGMDSVPF